MLAEISTTVGSVTVRAGGGDAHALRQSVSGQLSCADLTPDSLPPSAFLIVRQLQDPMPGRIRGSQDQPGIDDEWEHAAVEHLARIHEQAVRPAKGVVHADCDAIVFADEAEMLACLSIDLAYGCAMHHWWWDLVSRYLPGGRSSTPTVGSLLNDNCHLVPAALEHVSEWRQTEMVLGELSGDEAHGVLSATLDHFEFPELHRAIADVVLHAPSAGQSSTDQTRMPGGSERITSESAVEFAVTEPHGPTDASTRRPTPPWIPVVGPVDTSSSLTTEQTLLLGVALTFQRAPAVLRQPEFRSDVSRWWRAEVDLRARRRDEDSLVPDAAADSVDYGNGHSFNDGPVTPAETASSQSDTDVRSSSEEVSLSERVDVASETEPWNPRSQTGPSTDTHIETRDVLDPAEVDLPFSGIDPIRTSFGGVFFLINLIDRLGLPESCAGWRLNQHVGHWGLLEFLARKLLGAGPESHDPLWAVLSEFSNSDAPVLSVASNDTSIDMRLPPEWDGYVTEKGETFAWSAGRDRLQLWSSVGYLIANVERTEERPSRQALGELRRHRPDSELYELRQQAIRTASADVRAAIETQLMDDDLERWFAFVRPFLLTLMRQQMDMAEASSNAIVDELLKRLGDLFVTKSHIDLVFDIESVSMAVRRSGLDCDPGWLPEFGRVIKFHYQ